MQPTETKIVAPAFPEGHGNSTKPAWHTADIEALFALPFNDLLYRAQQVHRAHFDANTIQRSTLLSVKTGGCSEDCGYETDAG